MVKKKYLSDNKKVRKYLNQLINEINNETEPNIQLYRTKTYMLKTMLDCFELERSLEIEQRIDKIEKMLEVRE